MIDGIIAKALVETIRQPNRNFSNLLQIWSCQNKLELKNKKCYLQSKSCHHLENNKETRIYAVIFVNYDTDEYLIDFYEDENEANRIFMDMVREAVG